MKEAAQSVLVIGDYNTGKTLYGTQLLGRLRNGRASLTLRRPPPSVSIFGDALDKLHQGLAPSHTPFDTFEQVHLPLETPAGKAVDLKWPDYGGEQIGQMLEERRIPPDWQDRIKTSDGWLFFIRLKLLKDFEDIISRPLGELMRAREETDPEDIEWSNQARLLELLQMFMFFRESPVQRRSPRPALTIVLSCWDELDVNEQVTPEELFKERLPLLRNFINAWWDTGAWSVLGLSAQGKALPREEQDPEYVEKGPASFGYVVTSDGRSPDLSLPVAELMND